jgi:hypothetical protein
MNLFVNTETTDREMLLGMESFSSIALRLLDQEIYFFKCFGLYMRGALESPCRHGTLLCHNSVAQPPE